jgi:molybdopterin synthase catalytic subunit
MGHILAKVTDRPLTQEEVAQGLREAGHGAELIFWGLVRNTNEGKGVTAVSYDVHAPLAEKSFREIGEEALDKWGPDLRVVIIHRSGRLAVGEASVVIGVSSGHRDEAYQASRYIIEQLKVRSPIWKQEHYVDGDSEWLPGHSLASGN